MKTRSWNVLPNPAVVKYTVYKTTTSGSAYVSAGDTTGTSLTVNGLTGNTTYYLLIKGADASGAELDSSNEVTVTTQNAVPNAPDGLIVDLASVTTSSATLSWQPATDPDGGSVTYNVYYRTASGTNTFAGNTAIRMFTVNNLSSNTVYYFTVCSIDSAGAVSAASNEASVKTLNQIPAAPYNLHADESNKTSNSIPLTWSAARDDDGTITGYTIYYKQDSDSAFQKRDIAPGTSYTVAGLNPSTRYYIYVTATDNDGAESVPSNTIAVYTKVDIASPVDPNINTGGLPDTGTYYFHPDHVGSVKYVTNDAGAIVYRMAYDPFGTVLRDKSTGTSGDEFPNKYTSQIDCQRTGLMDYKARFYDPAIGRFISPDTIIPQYTKTQDFNRYTYVHNNPIRNADPSGHFDPVTVGIRAAIGAIVGGVIGGTHGDILHPSRWGHMRWDWKAAGKGAVIGAIIGASAGFSTAGFVSGSLNTYYAYKRGGTQTDIAVSYGFGWSWGAACSGDLGGSSIAANFMEGPAGFHPLVAYAIQGYAIAGETSLFTQTYFAVKRGSIKEWKWKDFLFAAYVSGPLGGMLIGGTGGSPGGYAVASVLYVGAEYYQSHEENKKTPIVNYLDSIKDDIKNSWKEYLNSDGGSIEDIFNFNEVGANYGS